MEHPARAGRFAALAAITAAAWLVSAPFASAQIEGSFERTLKVAGPVDLDIRTGSGRVAIRPGDASTVRITARLRAGSLWFPGNARDRIRQIEKNPPIEQHGNRITVGRFADQHLARNISISYDVVVPVQTAVVARTGSGGVEIGDLGARVEATTGSGGIRIGRVVGAVVARTGSGGIDVSGAASLEAHSGSGSIRASGISGAAAAHCGSGGVRIMQTGKGDVEVSSGSGEVIVTGVNGAARVSASSGGIELSGRPAGAWTVHASSGGVTLRLPPDAGFDLYAHASSGGIELAHPVTVSGSVSRHRMQGKVRGGGPLVDVRTSSGGIHIE